MAQGFSEAWRTVKVYCPSAPTFLVREWVNATWKQLAAMRRWGFMRGELALTVNVQRSLAAVLVTRGSPTVTSAGLFVAGDAGRQFRIGTFPVYTIQPVSDVNTIVLDRAYGEDDGSAAGVIFDGYATMPADFGSFRVIADPYNQRRLAFWITEDQLNLLDPTRQAGDSGPRLLAARAPSTYTPTLGRVQYEYWPRPSSARSYPAFYNKQASMLDDTTVFSGVLADGAQVLIAGALAHAARWPGLPNQPNPYFNAQTARDQRAEFLEGVQQLSLRDDEQYPDDLATAHWERWPLADLAYNDQALRSTDASVVDLY